MRAIRALLAATSVAVLAAQPLAAADEPTTVDCPGVFFADAGEVDCYEVVVPERHDAPDAGGRITLFVAILRAESADPRSDPVVFLHGGPGAVAAELAPLFAESALRQDRDIILFEQRGTALTDPYLGCPALDVWEAMFAADPGTDGEFAERIGAIAAECAAAHEAAGSDLSAYTTLASVEDLEAVRQALGIASWNLYGGSYGTRLGLAVLRRHPDSVRSAVFDGMDPPDADRIVARTPNLAAAVHALAEACERDAPCSDRFGDLEQLLQRALDRWRTSPTTVTARITDDSVANVVVDEGAVAGLVYSMLSFAPSDLPLALERLAEGDTTILEVTDLRSGLVAEGLRLSIECAETAWSVDGEAPEANDAIAPELALAFRRFPEPVACPRWPVDPRTTAVEPVSSDVPVLLVSGALDPITPPRMAEQAAATLGDVRHHVVPGGGHGAGLSDPCAIAVRDAFIRDPRGELPACRSTPSFVTDVVAHPGLADAWRAAFTYAPPSIVDPLPFAAVTAIGLTITLLVCLVAIIRGSRAFATRAIAVTSVLLLLSGGLIGWAWFTQAPIVSMVGLPSVLAWLPVATAAASAFAVVTVAITLVAVVRGGRPRWQRLALTAATVPTIGAVWILAANGLVLPAT